MAVPVTPECELTRAARRAVEMIRWWAGAPTQLETAWQALSVTLLEGGDPLGPAHDLVTAIEDRETWPPEHRRVMDELAAAVEQGRDRR